MILISKKYLEIYSTPQILEISEKLLRNERSYEVISEKAIVSIAKNSYFLNFEGKDVN
jgi:hypothetical protein